MKNEFFAIEIFIVLLVLALNNLLLAAIDGSSSDTTGRVGANFVMDVNNFELPINNVGMSGNSGGGPNEGKLNGEILLYSGGFSLAGKIDNDIWMSNVLYASQAMDYLPGSLADTMNVSKDIFVVRSSDPPFGKSWQDWKDAVQFGAMFYDGDLDGEYNPVDKNQNGFWDPDEDMPYLLGDVTAWCVYNDSEHNRRMESTYPVGIEIQQTIFASNQSHLQNTIFILYSIVNRGVISDTLSDTYFAIWADPDIGEHTDDLVGCDTTIYSCFTYNNGADPQIGEDPPALFFTFLQGPKVIDTTQGGFQTQAIENFGHNYGIYVYEGYRNLIPSSFQNHLPLQNPWWHETKFTFFNRMLGLKPEGIPVDPCNFNEGIVIPDTICDKINPLFLFSGDPVDVIGWINTVQKDQRNLFSIGPFNLNKDEPQHIIAAYTGAKGSSPLNSITVGRELVQGIIEEYRNNFPGMTYQPDVIIPINPVTSYVLYQNYPNPFNPTTTIRYELPQDGVVTIEVFDILGQKVKTILNEFKKADRYEVTFSSTGLASGVYIYQLRVNDFITSKKMMLIR
jgi:hypothetical protein